MLDLDPYPSISGVAQTIASLSKPVRISQDPPYYAVRWIRTHTHDPDSRLLLIGVRTVLRSFVHRYMC